MSRIQNGFAQLNRHWKQFVENHITQDVSPSIDLDNLHAPARRDWKDAVFILVLIGILIAFWILAFLQLIH